MNPIVNFIDIKDLFLFLRSDFINYKFDDLVLLIIT